MQVLGGVQELNHVIEKSYDIPVASELPGTKQVNAFLLPPVLNPADTGSSRSQKSWIVVESRLT